MKITKVIKDKKQTRITIPSTYVKENNINSNYIAKWTLKNGKLKAEIEKNE